MVGVEKRRDFDTDWSERRNEEEGGRRKMKEEGGRRKESSWTGSRI
jgi:hypothetical protein